MQRNALVHLPMIAVAPALVSEAELPVHSWSAAAIDCGRAAAGISLPAPRSGQCCGPGACFTKGSGVLKKGMCGLRQC